MKLEVINLGKQYKDQWALQNFTYDFQNGVYGILGPNGAGKSTLMNLLTDGIKRQCGEIKVDGTDILKMGNQYRNMLGYMAQSQGYYPQMTGREFLLYVASLKGISRKERRQVVEEKLTIVNLTNDAHKKISGYSGGMRQRLLLAQALIGEPKLIILDEPTAGLDPKERIRIRNLISEISENRVILLATHVVSDIECIAQKVLLMKKGHLIVSGTPTELLKAVEDKVQEKVCTPEEIREYQKKYGLGNVYQRPEGQVLRFVSDSTLEGFSPCQYPPTLEEVFLYYCEENKVL